MRRRTFLQSTAYISAALLATGAGALVPRRVLAGWPASAFEASDAQTALTNLLGETSITVDDAVSVTAPDEPANGAMVPVKVSTSLANVESITIVSEGNPYPLIASFTLVDGNAGYVQTRIKVGGTSDIVGVVKADGRLYSARKRVKVTAGACG